MKTATILKAKVNALGKKQYIVAREMGYTPAKLSSILNGRTPIYDTDIERFCIYLGCTPNDLIPVESIAG